MSTVKYIESTYYSRQSDNTYQRQFTFEIDGELYCFTIIIPGELWNISITKATTYWLSRAKKGEIRNISWGTLKKEKIEPSISMNIREYSSNQEDEEEISLEDIPMDISNSNIIDTTKDILDESDSTSSIVEKGYHCNICNKKYSFKSSLSRHKKICLLKKEAEPSLLLEEEPSPSVPPEEETTSFHPTSALVNNNGQNVTVMNIQNNVNIRSLGKENPRWLTSNLLFQVLSDIPSAIPRLMEFKHFNDAFPENKNIRIDTRRTIDKRLQVFDTGRWRVKDSKQTFYKVLIDIYDILSDALENDLSEPEQTDDDIPDEERLHIFNELTKLKGNARFIQKLEKIRPIWEDFREKIDDHEQRNDLWEDLKTLLLDRRLAIEQGFD
jgi:hypothetical protein